MNHSSMHIPVSKLITLLFIILLLAPLTAIQAGASTLTVTNGGEGSGNINIDMVCNMTPLGQCSATIPDGLVTLAASSDWKSIFNGWGGPCSGTGNCTLNLATDTNVPVRFDPNYQAIIVGHTVVPNFSTLTTAYAAAKDQYIVAANVYTFYEDLVLNEAKFVRFYLGKKAGFYGFPATGFTTLSGSLTIQLGSIEIDALIIR